VLWITLWITGGKRVKDSWKNSPGQGKIGVFHYVFHGLLTGFPLGYQQGKRKKLHMFFTAQGCALGGKKFLKKSRKSA